MTAFDKAWSVVKYFDPTKNKHINRKNPIKHCHACDALLTGERWDHYRECGKCGTFCGKDNE